MRRFLSFALALCIGLSALTASGARAGSPVYETVDVAIVEPIPADAPAGSSAMPGSGGGTYTVALVGLAVIVLGLIITSD
jgi:hypothetical protein